MSELNTHDAEVIAAKLGADPERGKGKHALVKIVVDGKFIAQYGIRRSSKKDTGHDFIAGQLHITMGECKRLSACTLSREEYFELIRTRGKI